MEKVVLLNSGGFDSACLAHMLKEQGYEITSLYFNVHLGTEIESKAAVMEVVKRYCVDHHEATLDLGIEGTIEDGGFRLTSYGSPWAMTFIGTMFARFHDIEHVYGGFRGGILRRDWPKRFNELIQEVGIPTWKPILHLPYIEQGASTYESVIKLTGVSPEDFAFTVSCGVTPPCDVCKKCKERAEIGLV
jgi:7-cyano-7-deazaguanine synthase in queuosine biosynthesis